MAILPSLKAVGVATEELTRAQNGEHISLNKLAGAFSNLTPKQILNVVSTSQLSEKQLKLILTYTNLTEEQQKEIVTLAATKKSTDAQTASTVVATTVTGGFKKTLQGLWATMLANPITTIITIATIAIPIIIKLHDWISKAAERHKEAMKEFQQQNEQAVSEINSINTELDSVKTKLEELDELARTGRITPDQEQERKDLQATREDLERQLDVQRELAELSKTKAEQAAIDTYRTTKYTVTQEVVSYEGAVINEESYYSGVDRLNDLVDAMQRVKAQQEELKKTRDDDKISAADYTAQMATLRKEYDKYNEEASSVAGDQLEIANTIYSTSGANYELKQSILSAIDAWRMLGATAQEKLDLIKKSAPDAMRSVAQQLVSMANEMGEFQEGNVDLTIRPEVEIDGGYETVLSTWWSSTLGDDNEYAIHMTPILSDGNVLTDDELAAYFNQLIDGAVSRNDVLEKDSVANGGKGLILAVKPRLDGQSDEQFLNTNNAWGVLLHNQQARYYDMIRELRDDSGMQEWIDDAVDAGIIADDSAGSIYTLAQAIADADNAAGSADSIGAFSEHLKSFNGVSESLEKYYKALQSLKDLDRDAIPIDLMAEIMKLCPEAAGMIHNVADAQQALTDKIETQKSVAETTYSKMILSNQDWLQNTINASATLQNSLAKYYGTDLDNFRKLAGTKWEIEKALVSDLATLWSKYENRTLDSLEKQLYYLNYQSPEPNLEQIRELQAVIDMRKALAGQLSDLVTFKPSSVKTSSSSKSSDDALKKEIEKTKNAFQEVYNEKKHLVDMEQKDLEWFYAWLNGENGYKKYFSDLTKYADEYRKYEKEVFDGLRQIHEDYIEDLGFEIDMLERQDGAETQVIAKLREKQAAYRQLLLDTEAYLRAAGMSEDQIARNDLVQEYTKAMYAVEDSIREVEERLYEDSRDKINDLIDLTEDMVKQEKEDMIDALEAQKDAYSNLISQRKELLQLAQREKSYADEVADKNKEIQKLQSRIEDLSLDDSRTAAIEKAKLQEELATLQKELADKQNDHYVETTEDALDKELKEFESTQDKKIDAIQAFLKDNEALNREALKRLDNMNQELFNNLERYAMKYTDTTREELVGMWNEAARAAEKYGSVTNAKEVFSDSDSSTAVQSILQQMKANGNKWTTAKTDAERKQYADANLVLGAQLKELLGKDVYRDANGVWWIGNQKLFTYHSGTPNVGGQPTLKQTEVFAKLEKGESVITPKHQSAITRLLSFFDPVEKVAKAISANQFSQYQFAGAGGPNVNVTIPLTLYGDMTAETMRVLKDHRREVADVVSKVLK